MPSRVFFFFAFIFAIELYAFQAFVTAFGSSPLLIGSYFGSTALIITSIWLYFHFNKREKIKIPRQLLMAIFFLLFIPKIFISIFLLIEDGVRLLKIGANSIAQMGGAANFYLGISRSEIWSWITLGFAAFMATAFVYGALFNVYNYKIRKVNLKLLKLPKSFNGLKVVQISDIHSGSLSDFKAVEKAVAKINALNPDLVFFTGDLVNNIAAEAVGFTDIFSNIESKHGVFSILGNHDYGDYMFWQNPADKIKNLETYKYCPALSYKPAH